MKIEFWAVNLNNGDGSTTPVQFQTKKQAETARENYNKWQGEEWNEEIYQDYIEITDDNQIVLGGDANYYLTGILEEMDDDD